MWSAALIAAVALAGPFDEKSSMAPWPEQQAARDLALPRGWMQLAFTTDTKISGATRGAGGEVIQGDHTWLYTRLWARFDQGFSDRVRLSLHVPFVHASLLNTRGAAISTAALGDVEGGVLWQLARGTRGAVAMKLSVKAPTGVEWPHDFVGGPSNIEGFLTGTGITNAGAHALGRLHLGRLALDGELAFVLKPPGVVGYVVESGGFGNGWLNPGDEVIGRLGAVLQVTDDLALGAQGRLSYRTLYLYGTSTPERALEMYWIPGPEGAWVDVRGEVSWEPDPRLELALHGGASVLGADTRPFAQLGLEEFAPQPGLVVGLEAVTRW